MTRSGEGFARVLGLPHLHCEPGTLRELRERTVSDTFGQSHRRRVLTKLIDLAYIESEFGEEVDATLFCTMG